jgi:RNA-directed DNA polymerase
LTFYQQKGSKGVKIHRKSINTHKDKIRGITCRSKPYPMKERVMKIRQLNQGWDHYFKLSEAKSIFEA